MNYINLYDFIRTLSDLCTGSDVIIPSSSGQAAEITLQAWKVKKGQRIISLPGLGSMGFALPMAIGASIASKKRVICIEGDGSLQHNIQELETMRRLNLPIKLFVLNNGGYASIRNTHKKFFNDDPTSVLSFPNLVQLAETYKIDYAWTKDGVNKELIEGDRPCIIEVLIDPNQQREVI